MKNIALINLAVWCVGLLISAPALAAIEAPSRCAQCGMERAAYAHSRMLITYTDGTSEGTCSLMCAMAEKTQHEDKQIKSLTVADYGTRTLIPAETATWVVGGRKIGVMSPVARWAFANEEDARAFVAKYGGRVTAYDQVLTTSGEEAETRVADHGRLTCWDMPGAALFYNPAFGDDIYHTHAGMWMVNYKYMHMKQDGLRAGTSNVGLDQVGFMRGKRYEYMMIPTSMTMDMHMLMVMYGVTERFTVMGMANYQVMAMDMLMDMGPMRRITQEPTMRTEGWGDTELRGVFKIDDHFTASLGLSLPTGDIEQDGKMMGMNFRAPYDMQLGSGSYDLKPALTYSDLSADALWNWGAQAMYTWHTADNKDDYRLGDTVKLNGWLQRAFGPASTWLRLAFNNTERISGRDPEIQKLLYHADPAMPKKWAPTPDADPDNYGGQRLDGALGVSLRYRAWSIGVEGGVPLYQYVNGLQLKTDWFLTAGIQVMF
ncbi:MAG: nitrous oxide reductase accessory protein NosL [Kiritimatiellaeota bacterium]|nr:nitrous oxide reductase accessory protein NosL [Kiritimatiellota bacterium]